MALQILFSFGFGLLLSTLSVFFRDLTHLVGILLHMWFWVTPIVYPVEILPKNLLPWILLNPLTTLVTLYRHILMLAAFPPPEQFLAFTAFTILILTFGTIAYGRLKDEIPDEV
jgi:ABC-type polysaccharide/polyol phosphate export permease